MSRTGSIVFVPRTGIPVVAFYFLEPICLPFKDSASDVFAHCCETPSNDDSRFDRYDECLFNVRITHIELIISSGRLCIRSLYITVFSLYSFAL